jgi:hypothetical protein
LVAVALVMQPVAETTVSATPVLIPLRTDFVPFGESLQLPQLPVIQFSTARVPKQNYLVAASATAVVLPILLGRPSRNGMTARCTSSEQGLPPRARRLAANPYFSNFLASLNREPTFAKSGGRLAFRNLKNIFS